MSSASCFLTAHKAASREGHAEVRSVLRVQQDVH